MRPLLAVTLATIALSCAQGAPEDERIALIESAIQPSLVITGDSTPHPTLAERMEELDVPGVSVAVIDGGRVAWAKGYGLADKERNIPVTPETMFQAASISKPVAGMAALKMVQDGQLDLDANVNEYLTSWQIPDNQFTTEHKVTLRGLLNHSAGTTVWGFPGYHRDSTIPSTVGVLDGQGNTDSIRVWKEPGESWRYSGGGYTVMQLMMADAAGKPFAQLMDAMVLGPLEMTNSTYEQPLPERRHAQAATAYRGDATAVPGNWHVYPEMAAAGLWTTPTDLAKYALEVQHAYAGEGVVLGQEITREMLVPGMNDHGLGPGISEDRQRFGHGGSNAGFRSQLTGFTEGGRGAVVMTNSDNGGRLAQELLLTIFAAYGWEGLEPNVKTPVTLQPEQYEAVAGQYRLAESGDTITITYQDGRLEAIAFGDDEGMQLLAESPTEFFLRRDGTPVRFEMNDGPATAVVVAGSLRGERIQ